MLEGMWKDYCDILLELDSNRSDLTNPTGRDKAYRNWLHGRWMYGSPESIKREDVEKVERALREMILQEQRKLDKQNLETL